MVSFRHTYFHALLIVALGVPPLQAYAIDTSTILPQSTVTSGKVMIEVDADCRMRVDGRNTVVIKARESIAIVLNAGEHLLECISTESAEVKDRTLQNIAAGKKYILTVTLAELARNTVSHGNALKSTE